MEIEIAERCFPLVISLLGMEEMPDFPIFKVPGNKAFEGLKVNINE
jgi:hypothetical protein